MRVIYLHQYFVTPDMAGGTRSYEMARRLVERGHEVHMVTTDQNQSGSGVGWRKTTEAGIQVHWAGVPYRNEMGFGRRIWAFLAFAAKATRKSVSLPGDVILATSTPLTIAIPALVASTWKRIPFVFEVRDNWPDVPIAVGALRSPVLIWLARGLEWLTYRRAAHVIALAPGLRDDIVAKSVPPERVSVIPNGCDLDLFAGKAEGTSPREEFPWLGTRRLVLFAGAMGKLNGVSYLVRVAAELANLDPEIRVVLIGSGRDYDAVRTLASQVGVLQHTLFIFPSMPKREVARWVRVADIVVALFTGPRIVWKDGVQNKFFDALAAGKPVACNFDGWQTRIAQQASIGVSLHPSDYAIAAHQLKAALSDQVWLDAVAPRAQVLAAGQFNRDQLAAQLEQVLLEVGQHRWART